MNKLVNLAAGLTDSFQAVERCLRQNWSLNLEGRAVNHWFIKLAGSQMTGENSLRNNVRSFCITNEPQRVEHPSIQCRLKPVIQRIVRLAIRYQYHGVAAEFAVFAGEG